MALPHLSSQGPTGVPLTGDGAGGARGPAVGLLHRGRAPVCVLLRRPPHFLEAALSPGRRACCSFTCSPHFLSCTAASVPLRLQLKLRTRWAFRHPLIILLLLLGQRL